MLHSRPRLLLIVLLLLLVTGCSISTSSEPDIVAEVTLEPNAAQQQARAAGNQPAQTEEPGEPASDESGSGPVQTEEPSDAGNTGADTTDTQDSTSAFADAPVVIEEIWFIANDINDEVATIQTWFFITNNSGEAFVQEDGVGLRFQLPAAATGIVPPEDMMIDDTTPEGPSLISTSPLAGDASRVPFIVAFDLPAASLENITFTQALPLETLIVYTPQNLRPQYEVPGYEFVGVREIRTLGNFLRFEQTNIPANDSIAFALQESAELRFADGVTPATLTVNIVNGTAGGTVPEGLEVLGVSLELDAQNQVVESFRGAVPHTENGAVFEGFTYSEAGLIGFSVIYNDIEFFQQVQGNELVPEDPITLMIYETTNDPSVLSLERVEYIGDAVTGEGLSQFINDYTFINTGDRAFIGADSASDDVTRIGLPASATQAIVPQELGNFARVELEDNRFYVIDSRPIVPDAPLTVSVIYTTAYDGSASFAHALDFDVATVLVYTPVSRALAFTGDGFSELGTVQLTGFRDSYLGYQRNDVAAGTTYTFSFADTENTPQFSPDGSTSSSTSSSNDSDSAAESDDGFLQENALLILGLGILIVIAGGGYLLYDLQKERMRLAAAGATTAAGDTGAQSRDMTPEQQEIIRQIAELDDMADRREITAEEYQAQRKALKDQLMDDM